MIVFLTVIYVVLLLLAFKLKILKPTLFWKLSPVIWMVVLLVGLFIPMQFWAPAGPLLVGGYSVQIIPNVQGEVIEVNVKPNQQVKKNDVLFRIDPTLYQSQVDTLASQLELARVRLGQAQKLAARGAGSKYDVEQFAGQVDQLEAQLHGARYNLEETTVRAPTDGFVTNVALRPGARVTNLPFVQSMAFVEGSAPFYGAEIPQGYLRYVEPGQPVEIAFKMYPGRVFDAEVQYVVRASSTGQFGLSGFAPAPKQVQATPFWVRILPGEEMKELNLPIGATGSVAIYSDKGAPTHMIRKVVIRVEAIMNYINPN